MVRVSHVPWFLMAALGVGCSALAGLGDFGEARGTGGDGGARSTGGGGLGGESTGGGGGTSADCAMDGQDTPWDPALVRQLAGSTNVRGEAVATDGQRRLIVGGWYQGVLLGGDLDDDGIVLCPDSGTTTSGFVARWAADGSTREVFCFGDEAGDQRVNAVAIGDDDTIFVGGQFVGSFAGYPVELAATEMSGMVIALDPATFEVAANEQIGLAGEQRVSALSLKGGELAVGGWFEQELRIGGLALADGGMSFSDAFVVSMPLDLSSADVVIATGDEVGDSGITGLAHDEFDDRLVAGGLFEGELTLDRLPLTSAGARDGFVTSVGPTSWVAQLGGTLAERVFDVAVGPNGDVFLVGAYETDGAMLRDATDVSVGLVDAGALSTSSGVVAALTAAGAHRWHHWVTSANGPFDFHAVATDGTYVLYGGSYKKLGLIEQDGSLCRDGTTCGDLDVPDNTTRSALLVIYDAADGSTIDIRLGQGNADAYLRNVTFDLCGSAVVLLEYSDTLTFGKTLAPHDAGLAVARLYRPEP